LTDARKGCGVSPLRFVAQRAIQKFSARCRPSTYRYRDATNH